jgi:glycosyltransferase involved in cell wall biosynthesis
MRRIYINGRFLTQPMTGVERYAYSICKSLVRQGYDFTLVCPKAAIQDCYDTTGMHIVRYGIGNSHFWEQCILPFFFLFKRKFLVFSFTGLGSILVRKKVMTIHDLSFLENPKWFSRAYYIWYKLMTPLAVRTSHHIITVSEFSKQEIQRFYPFVKEDKITVAYPSVDRNRFVSDSKVEMPDEHFALTVSSLDPRKNFLRLVEAFKGIKDCKLYIVGNANRVFGQQSQLSNVPDNVKLLGRVSDKELVRLYNQASCFIFPSIYEGFGLPPIEAMECGCPVLAADIPVIREVCAEAAVYFDPYNVKSIHDAIVDYFNDLPNKKKTMQTRGFANVSRFDWDITAQRIVELSQTIK